MIGNKVSSAISFLEARVMHARLRPSRHQFAYRVPYLALTERALSGGRTGLCSIDRANLFSVQTKDYGSGGLSGLAFVRDVLSRFRLGEADGEIVLITIPRMLGFAFNPVSFWLCQDKAGALRAVVAEVNNTFGERHFYVCRHADHRAMSPEDVLVAEKVFHVSPFMPVEGHYRFTFAWDAERFAARIDLHDGEGLILATSMAGRRAPFSSGRLVLGLVSNPLLMFKVLGLIHYQAVRLWAKRVRAFRKPPPPQTQVTG